MVLRSAIFLSVILISTSLAEPVQDPDYQPLRDAGIELAADDVLTYLRSAAPGGNKEERIRKLVNQLGADRFQDRRAAEKELKQLGSPAREALENAARGDDPEIRLRASRILVGMVEGDNHRVILSALRYLAAAKPKKGADAVLQIMPLCGGTVAFHVASDALKACLGPEDQKLLLKAAAHSNAFVRRAALEHLDADHKDVLTKCLKDKDESVRLAAAIRVLNLGDRSALAALVELLDSKDETISSDALYILQGATGTRGQLKVDEKTKAQWQAWLDGDGKTAKLVLPVEPSMVGNLVGSQWRITFKGVTDLSPYTFTLKENGKYGYPSASSEKAHVWEVRGRKIEFSVNNAYATYTGVIHNRDYMSGDARNIKGKAWTWEARRQE